MNAAILIVDNIINLIDEIGTTGNTQVDLYLSLLKAEKESVKTKLQALVSSNTQNIETYCSTSTTPITSSTAASLNQDPAETTVASTTPTPLELIKESATNVKTETDSKIEELNALLANSDLSPSVQAALESLLAMLTSLSGDFATIAAAGDPTTTTTLATIITTISETMLGGPGRSKREGEQ